MIFNIKKLYICIFFIPGQKACRYGGSCNRADCKFWHKGQELLKEPALDVGDKLAKIDK